MNRRFELRHRDRRQPLDRPVEEDRPRIPGQAPIIHLETLAREVRAIPPLQARIVPANSDRPAFLRIVNPDAGHLAEDIGCRTLKAGGVSWYYFWSWSDGTSDPVGPTTDPTAAARSIARVLAVASAAPERG